ncbi:MAG: hypothetical protein HQ559_07895, partial [Lentisphaerae bacterium]|nr:hypothetical protein [Lentisphaerota bacterium]
MTAQPAFEKTFPADAMPKRERVLATLRHQPVDRAALLEQLCYNPRVIADWTGKDIQGFDFSVDDICVVIRKTMDLVMPPGAPQGTARETTPDGFVVQHDNWTTWHISRPFTDEEGARDWLAGKTAKLKQEPFDPEGMRTWYHGYMNDLQSKIGETVI